MPLFVGQRLRTHTVVTNELTGEKFAPQGGGLFKIKDPEGNVTSHTATSSTPGTFEATFSLTTDGTWWGRFEGYDSEANIIAADEFPFEVVPSHF